MDKNTIIAIVLSTVVIIASYLILPIFFPGMRPTPQVAATEEVVEEPAELSYENLETTENSVLAEAETVEVEEDETLGEGFRIGHSYFCNIEPDEVDEQLNFIINYEIIPLLKEYWFDEVEKVRGMDIVVVTTANSDEEAYALLDMLGMPFHR